LRIGGLRGEWGLPAGPLASVVTIVEEAGVLVACRELVSSVPLDSGAESVPVDAVSGCPPGEDPVVLLNAETPAERQRSPAVAHPDPLHGGDERHFRRGRRRSLERHRVPARVSGRHGRGAVRVPVAA